MSLNRIFTAPGPPGKAFVNSFSFNHKLEGFPLFPIPTERVLAFVENTTGRPFLNQLPLADPFKLIELLQVGHCYPLHLNLGIPGVEDPPHPVEEHPETLQTALLLQWRRLPVLLSGELDLALSHQLISEKALSNLRNKIRISC